MKVAYYEIVDQSTEWVLNERYATLQEAEDDLVEISLDPDYPNPLYIRKTVCTVNSRGKTTRKDVYKC